MSRDVVVYESREWPLVFDIRPRFWESMWQTLRPQGGLALRAMPADVRTRGAYGLLCDLADLNGWIVELHETSRGVLVVVLTDEDEQDPVGTECDVADLDAISGQLIEVLHQ